MSDRVGQIWETANLIYLVVEKGKSVGSDHNNPSTVMFFHKSLDLTTGTLFDAREWSDDPWESRRVCNRMM